LSAAAFAVPAFNDYGSDSNSATYGYNLIASYSLDGTSVGEASVASQFVAAAGGFVSDLIMPIGAVDPGRYGGLNVDLLEDNGGTLGTVLESWFMTPTNNIGTWSLPITLSGDGSASLTAGATYWVSVVPTSQYFTGCWYINDANGQGVLGEGGNIAYTNGSSTWNYSHGTLPAFEVDVTAAPEPASLVALSLGALLALKRMPRAASK
jgi:hypothetical protein